MLVLGHCQHYVSSRLSQSLVPCLGVLQVVAGHSSLRRCGTVEKASPECREGEYCELRMYRVLRSSSSGNLQEVPCSKPYPSFACIASVERAGVSYSSTTSTPKVLGTKDYVVACALGLQAQAAFSGMDRCS